MVYKNLKLQAYLFIILVSLAPFHYSSSKFKFDSTEASHFSNEQYSPVRIIINQLKTLEKKKKYFRRDLEGLKKSLAQYKGKIKTADRRKKNDISRAIDARQQRINKLETKIKALSLQIKPDFTDKKFNFFWKDEEAYEQEFFQAKATEEKLKYRWYQSIPYDEMLSLLSRESYFWNLLKESSANNHVIVVAPGDSPAKFCAVIEKLYGNVLKNSNIHFVSFPISSIDSFSSDLGTNYIKHIFEGVYQLPKSVLMNPKTKFGFIDASYQGRTRKAMQQWLNSAYGDFGKKTFKKKLTYGGIIDWGTLFDAAEYINCRFMKPFGGKFLLKNDFPLNKKEFRQNSDFKFCNEAVQRCLYLAKLNYLRERGIIVYK